MVYIKSPKRNRELTLTSHDFILSYKYGVLYRWCLQKCWLFSM